MATSPDSKRDTGLRVIAAVKFAKGLLLAGIGAGIFRVFNRDLGEVARNVAVGLRIDPENREVRYLVERLGNVERQTLRNAAIVSLMFSLILFCESIGLWFNQSWALYVLLCATAAFIPFEFVRCLQRFTWDRVAFLAVNLAVLAYVVRYVWNRRRQRTPRPPPSP